MILQLREKVRVLHRVGPVGDRGATRRGRGRGGVRARQPGIQAARAERAVARYERPEPARSPTSSEKPCGGWPHERTRRRSLTGDEEAVFDVSLRPDRVRE